MSNTVKHLILAFIALFSLPALIFAILFLSTLGQYPVPATVNQNSQLPQVIVNQHRFHAETFGDPLSPPLLVLHDGPGGDYQSLVALKELASQNYVILFDQLGTGLSERVEANHLTLEGAQKDLLAIADHYAPGRKLRIFGHGWGGMLASAFAGANPQRVEKLILAEPGFLTTEMAAQVYTMMSQPSLGFMASTAREWVRARHVHGPDAYAQDDFLFARIRQHPIYHCQDKVPALDALPQSRAGFLAWKTLTRTTFTEQGKLDLNFTKGLEGFDQPVLLLASSCNQLTGKAFQARQAKLFKQAKLELIKNSGHEFLLDNPKDTLKVIRDYLK